MTNRRPSNPTHAAHDSEDDHPGEPPALHGDRLLRKRVDHGVDHTVTDPAVIAYVATLVVAS